MQRGCWHKKHSRTSFGIYKLRSRKSKLGIQVDSCQISYTMRSLAFVLRKLSDGCQLGEAVELLPGKLSIAIQISELVKRSKYFRRKIHYQKMQTMVVTLSVSCLMYCFYHQNVTKELRIPTNMVHNFGFLNLKQQQACSLANEITS